MRSITVTGNIGNEPEIRENKNTKEKFFTFSIAEDNSYIDKATGKQVESVEWFQCILNYERYKNVVQYLKKGSRATVIGYPTIHTYTHKETKKLRAIFRISVNQLDFFNAKEKTIVVDENGEVVKETKG